METIEGWFCNNGHTFKVEPFENPPGVRVYFGGSTSKMLCPVCLVDYLDKNIPELFEVRTPS